jgi:hypothetical protein
MAEIERMTPRKYPYTPPQNLRRCSLERPRSLCPKNIREAGVAKRPIRRAMEEMVIPCSSGRAIANSH